MVIAKVVQLSFDERTVLETLRKEENIAVNRRETFERSLRGTYTPLKSQETYAYPMEITTDNDATHLVFMRVLK